MRRRVLRDLEPDADHVSLNQLLSEADKAWHGVKLNQPDWSSSSHSLAFSADIHRARLLFHLILNAYWEPLEFELPPVKSNDPNPWRRWIDTALESPADIDDWRTASPVPGFTYRASPRSVVILFANLRDGTSPGL